MTLEQIEEVKTFLKSKGLSDDAIDGAVKSISFHEDTARIKDSEDAKRGLDIINFKPNPGKATLTQVGETQTYLGGDNRGLPIYQEDVDMIKKALPLAKRLIELQKTKQDGDTGNTETKPADTFEKWAMAEKKEEQTLKTLRDTIDEVYNVKPEELNMGPDTTENINEITDGDNVDTTRDMKEEDMMNLEAGWHRLPEKVKQAMLKSPEIEDEEIPDIMWYFDPKSQTFKPAETSNKNVSEVKDEAQVKDEDRKDPGDYYRYSNILKRMDDTHTRKNNDYGDAAYQGYKELGDVYYIVQLHNKLSRLKSLTVNNRTQQVKDESIDDTLLDLANYAIMFLESRHRV